MSLEKIFQSCSFAAAKRSNETVKSNDTESSEPYNLTSFFVDSSGRSSFIVPLQMAFDEEKDLDVFLKSKCFDPPPRNLVSEIDLPEDGTNESDSSETCAANDKSATALSQTTVNASLAFEVKSVASNPDDTNQVTVEGVSILACSVQNLVVNFKTKVTVQANTRGSSSTSPGNSTDAPAQMSPSRFSSSQHSTNPMKNFAQTKLESKQQQQQINLSTSFKITPVLTIESNLIDENKNDVGKNDFSPDLMQLGLAAIPDQMQYNSNNKAASSILSTSNDRVRETRLSPAVMNVTLTNAFYIAVESVPGPKSRMGNTLVSLSIQHSKTHNLPVTITNVAVHPGHSRHNVIVPRNNKKTNSNRTEGPPKVQQAVCKCYPDVISVSILEHCIHNGNESRYLLNGTLTS